jgi:hypothetical protein
MRRWLFGMKRMYPEEIPVPTIFTTAMKPDTRLVAGILPRTFPSPSANKALKPISD